MFCLSKLSCSCSPGQLIKKKTLLDKNQSNFFHKKTCCVCFQQRKILKKPKQTNRTVNGQNLTGTQYPFFFYRKRGCGVLLKKVKTNQTMANSFFA